MAETGVPAVGAAGRVDGSGGWPRDAANHEEAVRRDFVDALRRRALAHQGAVRRLLDARLAALGAAPAAVRSPAGEASTAPVGWPADAPASPTPLARLLDGLAARHADASGAAAAQTLAWFRHTWSRLNAERRWTESLAALPENAGPLHSQHVLHQAMTLMRDVSPATLECFVNHVEALWRLEQAGESDATAPPRRKGRGQRPPA